MHRKKRTIFLGTSLVVVVLIGLFAAWTQRAYRQERLNLTMIAAIKRSDTEAAIACLNAGADANARDCPFSFISLWKHLISRGEDRTKPTALQLTIVPTDKYEEGKDSPQLVRSLLDHGARMDARDSRGRTPFELSLWYREPETAWLFLDRGADVNAISSFGDPVLLHTGSTCAELLVMSGANVNVQTKQGYTPLLAAIDRGDYSLIANLLSYGAHVNACDDDGRTALKTSLQLGEADVVEWLLDYGADVHVKDRKGYTTLMAAAFNGDLKMVSYLLNHGLDVNAKDAGGWTALMYATAFGNAHDDLLLTLLRHGADINARNGDGYTALGVTRQGMGGLASTVRFLKQYNGRE